MSSSAAPAAAPIPGSLHIISTATYPPLTAFEYGSAPSPSINVLLWIGGLGDVIGNVTYLTPLAKELEQLGGWRVVQTLLTSYGAGWGTGSVKQDAEEVGKYVEYFRARGVDKIALMGHSTGCQDIIAYYHVSSTLPKIDGSILQAPVSDREFLEKDNPNLPATLDPSQPPSSTVPESVCSNPRVTYKRWRSLAAVPSSDSADIDESEDFFSSDLSDRRFAFVFGKVTDPLLVLMSGEDESYPKHVKARLPELFESFQKAIPEKVRSKESGILAGAGHAIEQEEARQDMMGRVTRFLAGL